MKKRFGIIVAALLTATLSFAQSADYPCVEGSTSNKDDKNILNHLDGSITLGTTGLGVDLAMPIGNRVQVRTGFSFFPHYEQTMHFGVEVGDDSDPAVQDEKFNKLKQTLNEMFTFEVDRNVDMKGKPTMKNFKLLVDVFPFQNKHWHVTGGFYWGPSTVAKAENAAYDGTSLVSVSIYNNLYEKVIASYESIKKMEAGDPTDPIPYITINGQQIYAGEELYNKFLSHNFMHRHKTLCPSAVEIISHLQFSPAIGAKIQPIFLCCAIIHVYSIFISISLGLHYHIITHAKVHNVF